MFQDEAGFGRINKPKYPASALIWGSESLNMKIILGYYLTGFPMDAVHASATVLFLWFGSEPMLEKLDRVKLKYGLVE